MTRRFLDVKVRTAADPAAVYALLADGSTWPKWSPIARFWLDREGDTAREGVGAVRAFRTGVVTSKERIVELVPGRRVSYEAVEGLPIRDYRADVDLSPDGDGTLIHWHSAFYPTIPGTGWFLRWFLQTFVQRMANGLSRHAEQLAAR